MNGRNGAAKRFLFPALALAMACFVPGSARADLIINFDSVFNGATPDGSSPWAVATFHTVSPGTVTLTMQNLMTADSGTQFIDTALFNIDPNLLSSITVTNASGVNTASAPGVSENAFGNTSGLAHSGLFDIEFLFQTANSGSPPRFSGASPNNISTWTITGPSTLTESSFNFLSTPSNANDGSYIAAMHVQGIPVPGDGTTSGGLTPATPEPTSILTALIGVGLIGTVTGAKSLRRRVRLIAAG